MTGPSLLTGYLPVQYLLTAQAALTGPRQQGRYVTQPVITGRTQQGLLAAALRRRGHPDTVVQEMAIRGHQVQTGPAVPAVHPPNSTAFVVPARPAPLSWHHDATRQVIVDYLNAGATTTPKTSQLRGWLRDNGYRFAPVQVRTTSDLHQQRDRSAGTTGTATGGPFESVTVAAGQLFTARWRISAADPATLISVVDTLIDAITGVQGLSVGAGRHSRHGGAPLISIPRAYQPHPVDARLEQFDHYRPDIQGWPQGQEQDLVLISPALAVDPATGMVSAAALPAAVEQWATAVTGAPSALQVTGQWVERLAWGGYSRHYAGLVPEQWVAAPGSVVRVLATRPLPAEQIRRLLTTTLGDRGAEGLGRFHLISPLGANVALDPAIAPVDAERTAEVGENRLPDGTIHPIPRLTFTADSSAHPSVDTDPGGQQLRRLQNTLLATQAAATIVDLARSNSAYLAGPAPTRSLLARLLTLLELRPGEHPLQGLTRLHTALTDPPPGEPLSPVSRLAPPVRAALQTGLSGGRGQLLAWLRSATDPKPSLRGQWFTTETTATPDKKLPPWLRPAGETRLLQDRLTPVVLNAWTPPDTATDRPAVTAAAVADQWVAENRDTLIHQFLTVWLTHSRRSVPGRTQP